MEQKEIWKTLKNYEGIYEVSNLGNVRSLDRIITYKDGRKRFKKGAKMLPCISNRGYYHLSLSKNGKEQKKDVHQLVAIAFLNHVPNGSKMVVNHKNFNRLDNNLENLEVITFRENTNKLHLKSYSKYLGVIKGKNGGYRSCIGIEGQKYHLGSFNNELDAKNKYDTALKEYLEKGILPKKHEFSSKHKGIYYHKPTGKWQVNCLTTKKYLGLFESEKIALNFLNKYNEKLQ